MNKLNGADGTPFTLFSDSRLKKTCDKFLAIYFNVKCEKSC